MNQRHPIYLLEGGAIPTNVQCQHCKGNGCQNCYKGAHFALPIVISFVGELPAIAFLLHYANLDEVITGTNVRICHSYLAHGLDGGYRDALAGRNALVNKRLLQDYTEPLWLACVAFVEHKRTCTAQLAQWLKALKRGHARNLHGHAITPQLDLFKECQNEP